MTITNPVLWDELRRQGAAWISTPTVEQMVDNNKHTLATNKPSLRPPVLRHPVQLYAATFEGDPEIRVGIRCSSVTDGVREYSQLFTREEIEKFATELLAILKEVP